MISRLTAARLPLAQIGSDAPFNVVPVDLVVDGITAVSRDPEAVGETLHLVDPEPLSSGELFEALAEEYAGRRPRLTLPPAAGRRPPAAADATLRFGPMRRALDGIPRESLIYLTHDGPVRPATRGGAARPSRAAVPAAARVPAPRW